MGFTGVSIEALLKPKKAPSIVIGTLRLSQSKTRINKSEMGTIVARLVSMYSQMSITKSVLAKNAGSRALEQIESRIQ